MLKTSPQPCGIRPRQQTGATLIITLVILVAMTLATIALMRSVDTTNLIAGNLAFRQAAAHAADAGAEDAANSLLPGVVAAHQLACVGTCPQGYISWRNPQQEPPLVGWDDYWSNVQASAVVLPTDAFGNTVSYVVESMCDAAGQVEPCLKTPPSMSGNCSGSDLGAGSQQCIALTRQYYRVTSRVQGVRNTVSFVQVMLAL